MYSGYRQCFFRLIWSVLFIFPMLAKAFEVFELPLAIPHVDGVVIDHFKQANSQDILLLGRDELKNKQLEIFSFAQGDFATPTRQLLGLDKDILFYDHGKWAKGAEQSLFLVKPGKVLVFDANRQTFIPLLDIQSIYRPSRQNTTKLNRLTFLHDLNQDGLADIILPDFTQTWVYLQQADGQFSAAQSLNMPAEFSIDRNKTIDYGSAKYYVTDYDLDQRLDIVFKIGSQLQVFYQRGETNGHFQAQPQINELALALPLTDEFEDFSQDHRALVTHQFVKLIDVNHDDIVDLVTKVTKSSGLFDKSSEYRFYFGAKKADGLSPENANSDKKAGWRTAFNPEPDAVLGSDGMQFELTLIDYTGDQRLDIISPSFELGIGSIIASLFSSSASLDVVFHPFTDKGYESKPTLEKELNVDFDLSSGQQVYPLLKISDFDGDKVNDLLIGNGTKQIYLYPGDPDKKGLFARKPVKFKVKLPKNGQLIDTMDLNKDGKTDILLRYDKLDGDKLYQHMTLLLAK